MQQYSLKYICLVMDRLFYFSCRCACTIKHFTKYSKILWTNCRVLLIIVEIPNGSNSTNWFTFIIRSKSKYLKKRRKQRPKTQKKTSAFYSIENIKLFFRFFLESANVYSPIVMFQLICCIVYSGVSVFQLNLVKN